MSLPAILVSGYLGAGKTTLINDFLRDPHGLRATVLVNDFGAINIDAELIDNSDGDTIALTNGCACCAIGDDLLAAARRATEATAAHTPDIVVVEASGVAEPSRIAMLLRGVAGLAPAKILTLVNGAAADRNAQDKFVGRLFKSQIASAHYVSVNRAEDCEEHVVLLLEQHGPTAVHVVGLADALSERNGLVAGAGPNCAAPPEFHSRVFELENPVSEDRLRHWAEGLPRFVHRAKGIVDTPDGVRKFDYCQGKTTLVPASTTPAPIARQIVAIGTQSLAALSGI